MTAAYPTPLVSAPIKRGTARRLGLHSVFDLRPGVTITRHHLAPLDVSHEQTLIEGYREADRVYEEMRTQLGLHDGRYR